ncbi:Zinc finger protein 40 [Blomia tropicalis]|nr:Zinc finger protein 40 [Blomia tropicalis]
MDGTTTNDHHDQSSSSSPTSSMKPDRIVYEVASDLVLLAQNQQLNKSNEIASKMITTDTSVNGNRHSSPIGDRRTSQPTSVIISRHSPPVNQDHSQVSTSSTQRKRIRSDRERSISESSSMVNTNNPFIHLNSPYPMGNSSQQLQLHQQYGVVRNNPTAALIAEEIKRAIATNNVNSNDPRIPFPNNIAHPMAYLQGGGSESSIGKRKSPIIFQTSNERKNSTSSVGRHFSTSPNVPLPPPPSTPLKPPIIFDPSTISGSDGMDQPIDLSKSSKPNEKVKSDVENLTSSMSHESSIQLQVENNRSPQQQQSQSSPNHNHRHYVRFRPMMEEKQLTEQLVRAFSPLHDMYPNKPTSNNGREMYKNVRSEEFAHLTPGVHTPHRLPQNMLLLGSRSSSTSTGSSGSGSTTTSTTTSTSSRSISLNNAYSTAEGKSVCNICMKQFSKPSQLRLHINIHFFERPFRCDSCAVSFRTKGHLQKHSRSVSHLNKLNMNNTFGRPSTDNPRPFKCSDCKIAFRIHGHLAKHLRSKMHIMKLECLGKLPFGMFAEMERSNINLTPIDTTDCEKALESPWTESLATSNDVPIVPSTTQLTQPQPQPPPPPPLPIQQQQQQQQQPVVSTLSGSIASTRSNTCHICGRLFKAAKFLQVHLYCDHPEAAPGSEPVVSSA